MVMNALTIMSETIHNNNKQDDFHHFDASSETTKPEDARDEPANATTTTRQARTEEKEEPGNDQEQQEQHHQQQQQHQQQQVHVLLEAIHILSQLAQIMDTTNNEAPSAEEEPSETNIPNNNHHHAIALQQRLDQLGQEWNFEDTDIPTLNHAIHTWHSHRRHYQTMLDQQELEYHQVQEQLRRLQQVTIPKYQRKVQKYKQRARIWQGQYHQQQAQRKSILTVAKDYIHNLHCGTAKQLAEAQMAYQVQVHEHALKKTTTTTCTPPLLPRTIPRMQRVEASIVEGGASVVTTTEATTTTTNTTMDKLLSTPARKMAQRLSFRKQKSSPSQQPSQQQQPPPNPNASSSTSFMANRTRTFSKESTASSDLSDGLDFQYDQEEEFLQQLEQFDEEGEGASRTFDDDEEQDGALSVTSSSSTCSLVTDQGVATLQLAPTHISSSSSSMISYTSPFASTTTEKRFRMSFAASSNSSPQVPQPPSVAAAAEIVMPVYTIPVAVKSVWFCKVPMDSTVTTTLPPFPLQPPSAPMASVQTPQQQQLSKSSYGSSTKPTPKGMISLESPPPPADESRQPLDSANNSAKTLQSSGQSGLDGNGMILMTPRTEPHSNNNNNHSSLSTSMKSLGWDRLLMGKQTPLQPSSDNAAAAVEYAFLVCGFHDPTGSDENLKPDHGTTEAIMVRPTLGARLVAIEGELLSVTESMTLQDLQKMVLDKVKTTIKSPASQDDDDDDRETNNANDEEPASSYVTMSFRNDVLTKAQQRLLDKAIAEKHRGSATETVATKTAWLSNPTLPSSLPLTGDLDVDGNREQGANTLDGSSHHRPSNNLFQSFFKLNSFHSNGGEASPDAARIPHKVNASSFSDLSWTETTEAAAAAATAQPTVDEGKATATTSSLRGMKLPLFLKPKPPPEAKIDTTVSSPNEDSSDCINAQPPNSEAEAMLSVTQEAGETHLSEDVNVISTNTKSSTGSISISLSMGLPSFFKSKQAEIKNEIETAVPVIDCNDDDLTSRDVQFQKEEEEVVAPNDDPTLACEEKVESTIDGKPDPDHLSSKQPDKLDDDASGLLQMDKNSSEHSTSLNDLESDDHATGQDTSAATKFHSSMKQMGRFFSGLRGTD
jgi:hypothetical protein